MSNQLIFHVHESFRLSCLVDDSKQSYQILDNPNATISPALLVPTLLSWIRSVMLEQSGNFDRIIFFLHANDFFFLPDGEFETNLLFSKLTDTSTATASFIDFIDKDLTVQYAVNKELWEGLEEMGKNYRITYHFLGYALINLSKKFSASTLVASIYGQNLNIAYSDQGEFKYYNQFDFSNEEELLYFILLAYKELDLDAEKDKLVIYGLVEEDGSLFQLLYQYIRNISLAEAGNQYDVKFDESLLSLHYFEPILTNLT